MVTWSNHIMRENSSKYDKKLTLSPYIKNTWKEKPYNFKVTQTVFSLHCKNLLLLLQLKGVNDMLIDTRIVGVGLFKKPPCQHEIDDDEWVHKATPC